MKLKPQFFRGSYKALSFLMLLIFLTSLFSGTYSIGQYSLSGSSTRGYTVMNNVVWSPEVRLTWMGNSTNADILKSEDGNYNVVWQDFRNGNWEIYYLKVRSDGFKLVNDTRITYYKESDTNPTLAISGNRIYIVWQRFVSSHWAIYFSRLLYSNKNIEIEIHPKLIRQINGDCTNPKIALDSKGYIHVVWQEKTGSSWKIMYEKVDRYGNVKISPLQVSLYYNSFNPQISIDDENHIHIFWVSYTYTPGYGVMYRQLNLNGNILTDIRRISVVSPETTIDSYYYNNSLYTVFSCSREKLAYEVIFTRLNSSGYTEVDDTNITPADKVDSIHPHLAVIHQRIFVVWDDYPEGVVRFSIYDEEGNPIGEILNLSTNNSFRPSISVNSHTLGIVWEKRVDNGTYLYFRSGEFPNVSVRNLSLYNEGNNSKNISVVVNVFSSAELDVDYNIYLDGSLVIFSTLHIKGEREIRNEVQASPGWHTVNIILDPHNKIIEYLENDNEKSASIFIKHFSFKVYLSPQYFVPAGRETNITIFLENTGNWRDNYTVALFYNKSAFKIEEPQRGISVNESDIVGLNFTIFTYSTVIVGNYTLNLTVKSLTLGIKESMNITLRVLPYVDFAVEYIPLFYALPGEKVSLSFLIKNRGNCNDTYGIRISQTQHWPLLYGNTTLNASYQSIAYFNVTLLVPNGTYAYTKNFINLTVKSLTLNISTNATVLIVIRPVHSLEGYVADMIKNGTYYRILFNIINKGNMKDLINLNLSGDVVSYAYLSNSSLLLNPGESALIWVNVYLPPLISAGSYSLVLNAYYQNVSLLSVPVSLTVEEVHRYAVIIEKLSAGNLVAFRIEVKNTGNAPEIIDVVPLLVQKYNATWIIYYMGDNYTNSTTIYVNPNQTAVLVVTLNTTLPSGVYSVNLIFSSASHINKNVTLEFRVGEEEKSIWQNITDFIMANLIYIVIIAALIGAVVVYLIKFRG